MRLLGAHLDDRIVQPYLKAVEAAGGDPKAVKPPDPKKQLELLQSFFIFSTVWAVGATVDGDGRAKFDAFLRQLLKRETPDDLKAFEGKGAPELKLPPDNKKVSVARAFPHPPRTTLTAPPPPLSRYPRLCARPANAPPRARPPRLSAAHPTPHPPRRRAARPRRGWCSTTATTRRARRGRSG